MDRFLLVALLTALIHLIGTLVYVARFSGVKTKRLATAFSLDVYKRQKRYNQNCG